MRVTFCKFRNKLYTGNSFTCLAWAVDKANEKNVMIPVYWVRAGSNNAQLFAEIDRKGIRLIQRGTFAKINKGAVWQDL